MLLPMYSDTHNCVCLVDVYIFLAAVFIKKHLDDLSNDLYDINLSIKI